MRKSILALIIIAVLALSVMSGCQTTGKTESVTSTVKELAVFAGSASKPPLDEAAAAGRGIFGRIFAARRHAPQRIGVGRQGGRDQCVRPVRRRETGQFVRKK